MIYRGAFAEVKKAVYIEDNSPYAVKVIDKFTFYEIERKSVDRILICT